MLSHPSIVLSQFVTVLRVDGLLQAGLQAQAGADEDPTVGVPVLSVGWISPFEARVHR